MQQDVVLREHEAPVRKIVAEIILAEAKLAHSWQSNLAAHGNSKFGKVVVGGCGENVPSALRSTRLCTWFSPCAQFGPLLGQETARCIKKSVPLGNSTKSDSSHVPISPVDSDIAGILRRMQPIRQRYRIVRLTGHEQDGLAPAQRAGVVGSKERADGHVVQHVARVSALPQPQHCDEPPVAERLDPRHHALHAPTQGP